MNEVRFTDAAPVDGYGAGFFRIGGVIHRGPIITGPAGTTAWTGLADMDALLRLAGTVDVLFVGTGQQIAPLPADIAAALDAAGLAHETMASPTAARTYNVLLGEGRRIALAMIPV